MAVLSSETEKKYSGYLYIKKEFTLHKTCFNWNSKDFRKNKWGMPIKSLQTMEENSTDYNEIALTSFLFFFYET